MRSRESQLAFNTVDYCLGHDIRQLAGKVAATMSAELKKTTGNILQISHRIVFFTVSQPPVAPDRPYSREVVVRRGGEALFSGRSCFDALNTAAVAKSS